MDGVGDFVDRLDAYFGDLDLGDDNVFVVDEASEYVSLEEVRATVQKQAEEYEGLPVFTVTVKDRQFKVFVRPLSEEAQIINKLSSPSCQPIVARFKEYHMYILLYDTGAFWTLIQTLNRWMRNHGQSNHFIDLPEGS